MPRRVIQVPRLKKEKKKMLGHLNFQCFHLKKIEAMGFYTWITIGLDWISICSRKVHKKNPSLLSFEINQY